MGTEVASLYIKADSSSLPRASREMQRLERQGRRTERATNGVASSFGTVKASVTAFISALALRELSQTADAYTNISNKLKLVTDGYDDLIQTQEAVFATAQATRSGYDSTADLYSRIARSTEDLNISQESLLTVTRAINQAFVVSGASAQEANAAVIQLGQGFASGTLRGDELNSVLEQAPRLARAFADGLGVSVGQLRKLGSEGKLTSQDLVKALLGQSDKIAQEYGQMSATVSQGWNNIGNSAVRIVGKIDAATGTSSSFAQILLDLSERLDSNADRFADAALGAKKYAEMLVLAARKAKGLAEALEDKTGIDIWDEFMKRLKMLPSGVGITLFEHLLKKGQKARKEAEALNGELKRLKALDTSFSQSQDSEKEQEVEPTVVNEPESQKVLAAKAALASLRKEIELIQARQAGSSSADLLGIDKDYADRVARIQQMIANPKAEAGVKAALQQQLTVEKEKYGIEREYAEKRIQLEEDVKAAALDVQLAELQGVDTYEAEKAAIVAKYAQMRQQYQSLDAQAADDMQAAEIAKLDREHLANLAQERAEYAQLTHNSRDYYKAQLDILEAKRTGKETTQQQLILEEKIAELQARMSGDQGAGAKKAMEEYADSATDAFQNAYDAVSSFTSSTEDFFTDVISGTKDISDAFSDMATSIARDLARMMVRKSITGPLFEGLSGMLPGLFSAHGNAFGPAGVHAFAKGGTFTNQIVSNPTLFAFAKGGALGVMGEAGDEAVMPLVRTKSGDLGVRSEGGGQVVAEFTITNQITVTGTGRESSADALERAASSISEKTQADILSSIRVGGRWSKAIRGAAA